MNVGERFAWVRAVIAAQPRPTLAEVSVAVALAEHFNAERGAAWPAQNTIAALTRLDRRNVRKALTGLQARGFIEVLSAGGPHSSASYALHLSPDGVPQRHQVALSSAMSGRSVAPSDGAAQRPEQVSRSENVGKPYSAAIARSPYGSRAGGGGSAGRSQKWRKAAHPVIPIKL